MKRQLFAVMAFALLAGFVKAEDTKPAAASASTNAAAATNAPSIEDELKKIFPNDTDRYSYAIGVSWGNQIKSRLKGTDMDFDPAHMIKGFTDAINGSKLLITEEQEAEIFKEIRVVISDKRAAKQRKEQEEKAAEGKTNLDIGMAFLSKNKTNNGVVSLTNGLQYIVLKDGSGPSPKLTDQVMVNYTGTLIDGKEFDSSSHHGGPSSFGLQGVIKGWTQVLQLMKAGSKWKVFIPPDLAYGETGRPGIPGNSVLIFEIELVSFGNKDNAATANAPANRPAITAQPLTSDIIKVPSAEEMKKGAKIETIKIEDLKKMTNQ